jgi:hypothetical protein
LGVGEYVSHIIRRAIVKVITKSVAILAISGLSLLSFGVTTACADEASLNKIVAKKVSIIENMHKKATRALVTAAQDKSFGEYFSTEDQATRDGIKPRLDNLSLNVQSKFDVDEMCLIDRHGHEHSRIVGKAIAPDSDLSTEEASTSFFELAFALQPKKVAIASNYVSPDTGRWVIAYVTPVQVDGEKPAFLHFEHNIDKFRALMNKGVSGDSIVLLTDRNGFVFSDSRNEISLEAKGEKEDPADYFKTLDGMGFKDTDSVMSEIKNKKSGVKTISDASGQNYLIAYKAVEHWTVAVLEKQ